MSKSSNTLVFLWLFTLVLKVGLLKANQEANPSPNCGPHECNWRANSLCRCEAFCSGFSSRCWKLPTGCHCQRGYARTLQGDCVPLALCI